MRAGKASDASSSGPPQPPPEEERRRPHPRTIMHVHGCSERKGGECRPFFSCHASPACPRAMTFRALPRAGCLQKHFEGFRPSRQSTTSSVYNVCCRLWPPRVPSRSASPAHPHGAPLHAARRAQGCAVQADRRAGGRPEDAARAPLCTILKLLPTGAYSTLSTLRRRLIAARAHSLTVTPRPRTRHGSESNRTLTRSAKRRLRD